MRLWTASGIGVIALSLSLAAIAAAEDSQSGQKPAEQPAAAHIQARDTAAEPSVTVLGSRQAQSVLGREVRSSANENIGRIVDVIVDRSGRVRAAIIDFGGFLGVGSRRIAVDWNALRFAHNGGKADVVMLELTRDQLKAAPEYKDKQPVIVLGATGSLQSLPDWE